MNDIIQIMTKNNYSKEVGLVIKKLFSIMLLQEMRGFVMHLPQFYMFAYVN